MKEKTLNIQTEHLENQMARLTVKVDISRVESAKREAAKRIARRVNIPGFRKGKAPYRILIQSGLEPEIMYDALEALSQEVYRESIEQANIAPYGPGTFEDFQAEPAPTFIYTVPLQPEVRLNDYRAVRLEYESPVVSDEAVDEAMKRLQQQEALVEESHEPARLRNRVTLDIHAVFADDPPEVAAEVGESDEATDEIPEDAHAHDHPHDHEHEAPPKDSMFLHEHDAAVMLDPDDEPVMRGFNENLVGAKVGDKLEFELTVPEDDEDYHDIAGRKIKFEVDVKKVEVVTLPELNDDLAARVTKDEEEPLTLLQLRMRMRETMQKEIELRAKDTYASRVIDEFVKIADVAYPPAMVDDQIEDMIQDLDRRLRQQGLSVDTYLKVTNTTKEQLQNQYRESAEASVKRMLVMREFIAAEKLRVPDADVDARVEEMLKRFGERADSVRSILDTPNMRTSIANDLMQTHLIERIAAIGMGQAPDLDEIEALAGAEPETTAEQPEPVEAITEPVEDTDALLDREDKHE